MRPTTSTKGILRPRETADHIDLRRYPVAPDLGRYAERYWAVHWDLRGRQPYRVGLIPHPCVNLTVIPGAGAEVHGLATHRTVHPLAGAGYVFGVKFRPGGFAAYRGVVASSLTDRSVPMRDLFGPPADDLIEAFSATTSDEQRIGLFDSFLRGRLPAPATLAGEQDGYELVVRIIAAMLDDRTITRVDQVARRYGTSVRTLQRLFNRYVGVGPKWVIRRYRMHDGAERLATGTVTDPGALAVELGWFDQAHFTRDFTAVIGMSPVEYAAANRADRELTVA